MKQYQFTMLMWFHLSDSEAKTASRWYEGAGWYFNPRDREGKLQDVKCVSQSDPTNPLSGQLEALNQCGAEGWSVAAFVPVATDGLVSKAIHGITGTTPNGPYFLLQRCVDS
jgi:hypothetical protein